MCSKATKYVGNNSLIRLFAESLEHRLEREPPKASLSPRPMTLTLLHKPTLETWGSKVTLPWPVGKYGEEFDELAALIKWQHWSVTEGRAPT
jgi:hypothetical protein